MMISLSEMPGKARRPKPPCSSRLNALARRYASLSSGFALAEEDHATEPAHVWWRYCTAFVAITDRAAVAIRRYQAANREKVRAATKRWKEANRDKQREYQRRCYQKHRTSTKP